MKKFIILVMLASLSLPILGQQDPLISMYMFNGLVLNPAYTGSHGYVSTSLLHRSQWVGLKGAPLTQVLSVHGPLADKRNAFGAIISNDLIGVTNQTDFFGHYAYHIHFDNNTSLSLGLKAGISWYNVNFDRLKYWDQGDEVYQDGKMSAVLPNFGAGAYYYSDIFYVGISVPSIMSYDPNEVFAVNFDKMPQKRRHYLMSGGVAIKATDKVVIKPSVLLKYVHTAPFQADFNLNVLLYNKVWVGASYRTGDAILGMVEVLLTKKLRIGYSYDVTLSRLNNYSFGSHEVMIGYDFGYDAIKMKTPRYF